MLLTTPADEYFRLTEYVIFSSPFRSRLYRVLVQGISSAESR
jgi:hypothetical protein